MNSVRIEAQLDLLTTKNPQRVLKLGLGFDLGRCAFLLTTKNPQRVLKPRLDQDAQAPRAFSQPRTRRGY